MRVSVESNSYGECRIDPTSVCPPIYLGGLLSGLGRGRREHKNFIKTNNVANAIYPTLELSTIQEYAAPRKIRCSHENVATGMRVRSIQSYQYHLETMSTRFGYKFIVLCQKRTGSPRLMAR